jgi:hypothetical protein
MSNPKDQFTYIKNKSNKIPTNSKGHQSKNKNDIAFLDKMRIKILSNIEHILNQKKGIPSSKRKK